MIDMSQKIVHKNSTSSYSASQATSNNWVQLLLHVYKYMYTAVHVFVSACMGSDKTR